MKWPTVPCDSGWSILPGPGGARNALPSINSSSSALLRLTEVMLRSSTGRLPEAVHTFVPMRTVPLSSSNSALQQQTEPSHQMITCMRLLTPLACSPGRVHRQPLSTVESSRAIQTPMVVSGVVYKNVLSWCGTTSPPMLGCCRQQDVSLNQGCQAQQVEMRCFKSGCCRKRHLSFATLAGVQAAPKAGSFQAGQSRAGQGRAGQGIRLSRGQKLTPCFQGLLKEQSGLSRASHAAPVVSERTPRQGQLTTLAVVPSAELLQAGAG